MSNSRAIRLRPMRADEFDSYVAYFVPDYAAEISANFDVSPNEATVRAQRAVADDLGQGVDTPGQDLLCVEDDSGVLVGYLWCKPDSHGAVFISDFVILPAHRGQGLARGALAALDRHYAQAGLGEVKLRVAADNTRAQKVYEAAGFQVTGINMRKAIGPA